MVLHPGSKIDGLAATVPTLVPTSHFFLLILLDNVALVAFPPGPPLYHFLDLMKGRSCGLSFCCGFFEFQVASRRQKARVNRAVLLNSAIATFYDVAISVDVLADDAAAADDDARPADPDAAAPTTMPPAAVTPAMPLPSPVMPAGVMAIVPSVVTPLRSGVGSGRKGSGGD